MTQTMTIEVVLALPQRCWRRKVNVPAGTTAAEAVRRSGLDAVCEHEAGETPVLGVFGRKVAGDHPLQPGERLELYRGLVADPRARRAARVEARRSKQGGRGGA